MKEGKESGKDKLSMVDSVCVREYRRQNTDEPVE
jgi:hypothetical protein